MEPLISVITIAYNSEKTIENTIKSVIEQDYSNKEYIVIDGGSSDGTVDIIKKYEKYISYWVSEHDDGISDAFNKGIRVAKGDVIGIVNSDDQYIPGALSIIANNYDENIDVYRGTILIHEDGKEDYTYQPTMKFGLFPIKVNVCHLPTFISKKAYIKYGVYDVSFKLAMDLDLLRRFYRKGATFKKIDDVLGKFNVGGLSTKSGIAKCFEERRKVIISNGGNKVDVFIYDCYLALVWIFKNIILSLGINYRRIRYK